MKDVHYMTLPEVQAKWWQELCVSLGIVSRLIDMTAGGMTVLTVCEKAEREAAWELFKEQYNLNINCPN
jgi:hypothetical protein